MSVHWRILFNRNIFSFLDGTLPAPLNGCTATIITRALEKGAHMVVVDPYLSDTAAKAHEWVSIRPATDGAMALAMGHVIVR